MKISFIIPSVDRDQELQQCIASIENAYEYSKEIPIEILVVFQNTQQNKNICTRYPGITTYYYINEKGLSVARNYGIKKSNGEYLVFLDDDATVKEDFLYTLSRNIILNNANAFCGRIYDPTRNVFFSELFHNKIKSKLNRFDFRYFMGSAHILSKKVIEEIGYYDERFGAGSQYPGAEESDVFFRLKAYNEKIYYLPELIFFHRFPDDISPLKIYDYSYAIGAVLIKNSILDKPHSFIYFIIIFEIILKASIRVLQTKLSPRFMQKRNARYQYYLVLKGLLKGIISFIRYEL